ncbi:MAG: AAA family ATPase [Acidobacteriaceae bacterium]|nr:AAA family ATPase [Acidobacteriaceae bacterium]
MFATFYSYKGGVGRSLALANVAWLLANHPTEPARVLTIDFDLNAPGLHKVFGMEEHNDALGIVDFVQTFISEARIDSISSYIHKTQFPNIDILPAGLFNSTYQARLEAINWKELYEDAYGFEFINRLKQMILDLKPAYDYVLVDSLTGYSDVGGICVRQLPDCVVLLFRLNDQNLDGIESVYKSIKSADETGSPTPVIPVITPAWPFLDSAATKWYEKAKSIFSSQTLSQISFDGGLSFGESIISQSRSTNLRLAVLSDYEGLALRLRSQNAADPLTMWNSLRSRTSDIATDSLSKYQKLLALRPKNEEYWQYLPNIAYRPSLSVMSDRKASIPNALQEFRAFVDKQCELSNEFALLARFRFETLWNPKGKRRPIDDLNKALEISPGYFDALIAKGHLLQFEGNPVEAVRIFKVALNILPAADRKRGMVFELLGGASLDVLDGDSAVDFYLQALRLNDRDADLYSGLSRAYYLVGKLGEAFGEIERFRSIDREDETTGQLLPTQILAAMGKIEEAKSRLDQLLSENRRNRDVENLAEAYLAVDPAKSLDLLSRKSSGVKSSPVNSLQIIAKILLGEKRRLSQQDKLDIAKDRKNKKIFWSSFELTAMLRAASRSGRIAQTKIRLAEDVLRELGPMSPAAITFQGR